MRGRIGLLLAWALVLGAGALAVGLPGCAEASSSEEAPAAASSSEAFAGGGPGAPAAFTEVTAVAGLQDFRHQTGAVGEKWMPEFVGAGGGFFDYDGDGWLDVVLVGGGVWSGPQPPALRLYRNGGDGTFAEVTKEASLAGVPAYGFGIAAADYDNDGDTDLHLTTLEGSKLFRNDGGRFQEASEAAGVAASQPVWSTAAAFFDADRDGHLDLYVGGYVRWSPEEDLACSIDGQRKAYCTPENYPGAPARFYHNNGDGTFSDWTEKAGFATAPGKTLGAVTLDHNRDGWPDLIVANDTARDLLYENRGDGTFAEKGRESGLAYGPLGRPRAGMGADVGDVDGSGEPTFFVGNFSSEMTGVYRHAGGALFTDRAERSGIGRPSLLALTFGLFLFDADLDGDLDLFAANGHVDEGVERVSDEIRYRQRPQLFLGQGDGQFSAYEPPPTSPLSQPLLGRGAAYGDYDRDGDLDVLVTENGGPVHLFRNDVREGAARRVAGYLRVHLEGRASNRDGIGARVVAVVEGRRQERRVRGGASYLSQSERAVTFGLRAAERVDTLRVEWPSGQADVFTGVEAGREVRAVEGAEALLDLPSAPAPGAEGGTAAATAVDGS